MSPKRCPRLSVGSLLLFVTAFCLSLALTWLPAKVGALILVVVAAVLRLRMTTAAFWSMSAGALLCIALSWTYVVHQSAGYFASTYNEAGSMPAFLAKWEPFAIQLGAFVGGLLGLLLYTCTFLWPDDKK